MTVEVEWWMGDDGVPYVGVMFRGTEYPLSVTEAQRLRGKLTVCIHAIREELSRYIVLSGWGAKYHLIQADAFAPEVPALCGRKPSTFSDGETAAWMHWPLLDDSPSGSDYCLRCLDKYEKREGVQA